MNTNLSLRELTETPAADRNRIWENQFLQALTEAKVQLISENPVTGPDNWPYIFVETNDAAKEPVQKVLQWLATRGLGLAINPNKQFPDYILTYGMIWSFRESGYFFKVTKDENGKNRPEKFVIEKLAHAGTPTDKYLPTYVRQIMRDFFRDQGILQPRILLLSEDREEYHLAFSLESLGQPPELEHHGICEAISWFLPPHYSIVLVSEAGLPEFSDF